MTVFSGGLCNSYLPILCPHCFDHQRCHTGGLSSGYNFLPHTTVEPISQCTGRYFYAAACLLTSKGKCDHITAVFAPCPFLGLILFLAFKVLNGLTPPYLTELLYLQTPVRARSTNQMLSDVLISRHKNRGDQAFAAAASNLWNSLPVQRRTAVTLKT